MDRARAEAANRLLGQGRIAEALEILERTKDAGALDRARRDAVRAGDVFALARTCQILKAEAAASEWRELSQNAERAERWFDAVKALERAGDPEASEAIRAARCPDFRPLKPAGK
jgi:hypothetical protein